MSVYHTCTSIYYKHSRLLYYLIREIKQASIYYKQRMMIVILCFTPTSDRELFNLVSMQTPGKLQLFIINIILSEKPLPLVAVSSVTKTVRY